MSAQAAARDRRLHRAFATLGAGLVALCLAACGDPTPKPGATAGADSASESSGTPEKSHASLVERQRALFDKTWQRRLERSPTTATFLGDARYNDRWDDLSLAAYEADHAADVADLEAIKAIDREQLPPAERINHDLFRRDLEDRIEGYAFQPYLMAVSQLDGPQLLTQIVEFTPYATVKDYENWLSRLQGLDRYIDQTIMLLRAGMAAKRMRPRIVMQRVLPQIATQLVTRAEDSAFYAPFKRFPDAVPADVRTQLDLAGQSTIIDVVVPALRRLYDFLEKEYLPACPENEMGLMFQPRGAEFYAYLVKHHTSTNLTPDQIHEIGLAEVARIRQEMATVMRQAGHMGSIQRFKEKLSWNPRYTYTDPAALLDAYRAVGKRIDPELPRLFGKLPRTPYGVRAIPDIAAPSAPAAYYYPPSADGRRAGYFYANTWHPESRPGWEMEALTAHEAVPGHHLQIALANEMPDIPEFRRHGLDLTAFVEGWGLYAESLGSELGLYQDVGSRFGRLNFEMWRAVRLVVDTGLHAKGWTRKKAREYARENAPKSEEEIAVEVDRYLAMPGQALAYKIGELRIQELRKRAKDKLGDRFDIRGFHDTVLGSGALPLDLLEQNVDAWIAAQAKP
jgi:uncharacterized protein (DUF885 family)